MPFAFPCADERFFEAMAENSARAQAYLASGEVPDLRAQVEALQQQLALANQRAETAENRAADFLIWREDLLRNQAQLQANFDNLLRIHEQSLTVRTDGDKKKRHKVSAPEHE
jgi:hypothetical protein